MNGQFHTIRSSEDSERFQDVSNGLHDGHIIRVEYVNSGVSCTDNSIFYDPLRTNLVFHILVTSLPGKPTFEIVFNKVLECQIKTDYYSDMIGFSIQFLDHGYMLWADDIPTDIDLLKQGTYVIAESIQYRML